MKKNLITEILLITLAVLTIFIIQATAFQDFSAVLFSDNAIYAALANRFFSGDFNNAVHIWWQPLLPLTASLFMLSGLDTLNALFYVNLVSGALLFIPVFYLTRNLTNSLIFSFFAGILASFNGKLVTSYFQLLTENLYVPLFTAAILLSYLFLNKQKPIFIFLAGIFYGLGYLTRSDILLPMQIFGASLLILLLTKKITFNKFLLSTAILGTAFLIIISPYLYFNTQKFGYLNLSAKLNASLWMPAYFAPQQNFTTTYAQEVWSIDTPNYDSRYFNEKFDFWKYKTNMIDGAKERFKTYLKILKSENSTLEVILFFFGFFSSTFYFLKNNNAGLYLNSLILLNFFLSLPFQPGVDLRYLFWAYPLMIILSILGLFILFKFVINRVGKYKLMKFKSIITVSTFIPLAILSFYLAKNSLSLPPAFNKNNLAPDPYIIIGSYIKSIDNSNPRIMYRRESVAYYANAQLIYIPTSIDTEQLKEYAKLWNVDYLIADRFTFAPEIPLGYLVDETKAPSWLKPIKTWEGEITKTILYKFEF